MDLKPGSRWKSAVCDAQFVVVRSPKTEVELCCGGHAVIALADDAPDSVSLSADHSAGSLTGKRYTDEDAGLEVLCTKPGTGSLSIDGRAVEVKEAKKLPSSD